MSAIKYKGFTIREITTSKGAIRYQLDMVQGGKRVRANFTTKAKAKAEAQHQKDLQGRVGQKAFDLSDSERSDATLAIKALMDAGMATATLQDAVREYIKRNEVVGRTANLSAMIVRYLAFQRLRVDSADETNSIRPRTFEDMEKRLKPWGKKLGKRKPDSIDADDIQKVLKGSGWGAVSQRNYLRHLSLIYGWMQDQKLCNSNPASRIKIKVRKKDPAIYEVKEVMRIMEQAVILRPELVPYFALGFFAGVRPDELLRLRFEDVDFERGIVSLSAEQSKTHTARNIVMKPNLKKWLVQYKGEGLIFPSSRASLTRWRSEVYREAGVASKQDGARHTAATFNYAMEGLDKTIDMLGHVDSSMFVKHYKNQIVGRDKQAVKFFAIAPDMQKVVSLKTCAGRSHRKSA